MESNKKRPTTVEDFVNSRTSEGDNYLDAEKRYKITLNEESKKYTISISGQISGIENLGHFLREVENNWGQVSSQKRVYLDLTNIRYACSTFYNLLSIMAEENLKKRQTKLCVKASPEIKEKILLFKLDKILEIG